MCEPTQVCVCVCVCLCLCKNNWDNMREQEQREKWKDRVWERTESDRVCSREQQIVWWREQCERLREREREREREGGGEGERERQRVFVRERKVIGGQRMVGGPLIKIACYYEWYFQESNCSKTIHFSLIPIQVPHQDTKPLFIIPYRTTSMKTNFH